MNTALEHMTGLPSGRKKTHRGTRGGGHGASTAGRDGGVRPGAAHLEALRAAHARGDHTAAKTHALNYANEVHAHQVGAGQLGGMAPLGGATMVATNRPPMFPDRGNPGSPSESLGSAPAPAHLNRPTGEISDAPGLPGGHGGDGTMHDGDGVRHGGHPAHFIAGAIEHPGYLHRVTGTPQGKKIPEKKIAAAEHSSNPHEERAAHLAVILKHTRHGKK